MTDQYKEPLKNRMLANGIHALAGVAGGCMAAKNMDDAWVLPTLTIAADVAVTGIENLVVPLSDKFSLKDRASYALYNSCMKGAEALTCAGLPGMLAYMAVYNG